MVFVGTGGVRVWGDLLCGVCRGGAGGDGGKAFSKNVVINVSKLKQKIKVASRVRVRVNVYDLIARAVNEGVEYGWNRAHEHRDNPDEMVIKSDIYEAVILAVTEVLVVE